MLVSKAALLVRTGESNELVRVTLVLSVPGFRCAGVYQVSPWLWEKAVVSPFLPSFK